MNKNLVEFEPTSLGRALIAGIRMHRVLSATLASEDANEITAQLKNLYTLHEQSSDVLVPQQETGQDFLTFIEPVALEVGLKAAIAEAAGKTVDMAKIRAMLNSLASLFGLAVSAEAPAKKETPPKKDDAAMDDEDEQAPVTTGDLAEFDFCESWQSGTVTYIDEGKSETGADVVKLEIEAIQPGWGNKRDKHYYGKKLLRAHAPKFVGAKMFETNHVPGETNNRTWVSTILEQKGFSEVGAPRYIVGVHRPEFVQMVRNLKELGQLDKLACSIRARGKARPGKVGEQEGNIVEEITEVVSVDWVAFAGAGGSAKTIVEQEAAPGTQDPLPQQQEQEPPQPTFLAEDTAKTMIAAAHVPVAIQERLASSQYLDEQALRAAIQQEREYVSRAVGAGRASFMGESSSPPTEPSIGMDEVNRRRDEVNDKHLHHRG